MYAMMVLMVTVGASFLTKSWLMLWLVMEINMVGMTTQLMSDPKSEKLMLFFIFQSLPAMGVLLYAMLSKMTGEGVNPTTASILVLAIICKIGMFPTQSWVLKLSKAISWVNNLILMTLQKLIPILILVKTSWTTLILMVTSASMLVMSSHLVSLTALKPFMMASSMVHMSWMIMMMKVSKWAPTTYLGVYSLILLPLGAEFLKNKSKTLKESPSKPFSPLKISIFSLSGMPPLTGFSLKAAALMLMMTMLTSNKVIFFMVVMATMSFYAYAQVMLKNMLLMKMSNKTLENISGVYTFPATWNLVPLMIIVVV